VVVPLHISTPWKTDCHASTLDDAAANLASGQVFAAGAAPNKQAAAVK
jgi:hypothetical protein